MCNVKRRWLLGTAVGLFALLFLTAAASAQFGGTDSIVDAGGVVQNEISLTLIPGTVSGQPQTLLAAYNDDPYWPPNSGAGLGVSYSTDGGATWTGIPGATVGQLPYPAPTAGGPIPGAVFNWAFDPTATADTQGNLFVGHIAADTSVGGDNGLYVWRSGDGGLSWTQSAVSEQAAAVGFPDFAYRFNDRCQITADRTTGGAYSNTDRIYIAWIQDRGYYNQGSPPPSGLPESDIYCSYSNDGGVTFSTPLMINQPTGLPLYQQEMGNMPVPRVAADGTAYVSWLDYNVWTGGTGTIYLTSSNDGGVTFPTVTQVATINLPPLNVNDGSGATDALAKGAPVLATSPTNANNLYMVYAADPDGLGGDDADIFFIRSTNQGTSWSAPLRLNTDTTPNDQILPWIDVKANGTIDVAWYDRRNDVLPPGDQFWDVFITRSTNGGASFSQQVRLNDQSFITPQTTISGPWMGEYLGLVVDADHAYVAWTSSVVDTNGDVYFDKIANVAIPEPSAFLLLALGGLPMLLRRRRR